MNGWLLVLLVAGCWVAVALVLCGLWALAHRVFRRKPTEAERLERARAVTGRVA